MSGAEGGKRVGGVTFSHHQGRGTLWWGKGSPLRTKGRQRKGARKASAVRQTGGGVCERGLAHPSPRLGAPFARNGEGVERAEAGGGNRVLPTVGNDTRRRVVYALFAFILFIVAKKKIQRKRSLNLSSG